MHSVDKAALKRLHFSCLRTSIQIARDFRSMDMTKDYERSLRSIKMRFFDKIYYKRGYSFDPKTKLYTWVY